MFRRVELNYCQALFLEPWNASPGRFFVAYKSRHGFRGLIGNGVVDEFHTISAPLFITPNALLGKIYDTGMALADRRDIEAPLDLGWPPLCIGLDIEVAPLPDDWQAALLDVLMDVAPGQAASWPSTGAVKSVDDYEIEYVRCGGPDPASQITVLGTTAPLLPGQLERLADVDSSGLTVAVATGNRIVRSKNDEPQRVESVSETLLDTLTQAARALLAEA